MERRGLERNLPGVAAAVVTMAVLAVGTVGQAELAADPSAETYGLYRLEPVEQDHPLADLLPEGHVLTDQVPGAEAELDRHEDRVDFTLTTTELQQHAYTVWLIVYNFPEHCTDPDNEDGRDFRCGQGDMLNLAAGFSIMYGTGDEVQVTEDGFHTFEGSRSRFDPDGVLVGPGLVDPQGAEIHLLVRDHGPCPADGCGQRTTTVDGGCSNPHFGGALRLLWGEPGDYECKDVQATGY